MTPIETPYRTFTDRQGKPLEAGYIYIGQPDQNPETAPVTVYWDAAGLIPAAQPIRTSGGYPVRDGTPANMFYDAVYSITVRDRFNGVVYSAANSEGANGSSGGRGGGFRNRIHNSNFSINQRRVSGAISLIAGQYGHDRWKAGDGGCSYTIVQEGIDYYLNITAGSIVQVLQGLDVEGGYYRLSHAGSAQARVAVSGQGLSGPFLPTPFTTVLASGGVAMAVEFGVGTVHKVQLEPGAVETPYARVPPPFELLTCQQFFVSRYSATRGQIATGQVYLANMAAFTVNLPVKMRASPTLSSANIFITDASGSPIAGQTSTISYFTGDTISLGIGVSGGLIPGNASLLYCGNNAGGVISFSADL